MRGWLAALSFGERLLVVWLPAWESGGAPQFVECRMSANQEKQAREPQGTPPCQALLAEHSVKTDDQEDDQRRCAQA